MIYTYEILTVDEASRCMEIAYSHDAHGTMHVGVRLPFEGESIEGVIKSFAPLGYWRDLEKPVTIPREGVSGTIEEAQTHGPEVEPNEVTL